eukprot:scaffold3392_cov131-Isochrysis_galbana.AAC.4
MGGPTHMPHAGQYADALSRDTKVCLILILVERVLGGNLPTTPPNYNFTSSPNAPPEPPPLIALNMAVPVPPLAPEPICSTTHNASPGPPSLPTPKPFARRWFPTSNRRVFSPAFPVPGRRPCPLLPIRSISVA